MHYRKYVYAGYLNNILAVTITDKVDLSRVPSPHVAFPLPLLPSCQWRPGIQLEIRDETRQYPRQVTSTVLTFVDTRKHSSSLYSTLEYRTGKRKQPTLYWTLYNINPLKLNGHYTKLLLSIGLWRWYIDITITILDIIHRPVFYLKHDVSETGLCLRIQVEPTQLDSVRRQRLVLSVGPNGVGSKWTRGQNPVSETLCFK
jgi:hypothetical protein